MRLVCRQTQHDEVCVSAVETVVRVGVMVRSASLPTNIVHYLEEKKMMRSGREEGRNKEEGIYATEE